MSDDIVHDLTRDVTLNQTSASLIMNRHEPPRSPERRIAG